MNGAVPPAVMVAGLLLQVIGDGIAAVGREGIIEIEDRHIVI